MATPSQHPATLGGLQTRAGGRRSHRTVKDEVRANLIQRLRARRPLFPGVVGYDDTVIPQLVNAILSKHNFILLGLRGQAKTRLLRSLVALLDEYDPGRGRLRDARRSRSTRSARRAGRGWPHAGDDLPIEWLPRDARYVEKLATPDVTIADLIGDVDPIKAARARPRARRRADDALRPAAARQPRHLRHQRAAGPGRQDPGGPVQHPAGRRRADQGLSGPAAAGRADGLHGQPRGLHGARQDHHAAQGSHRLGDPHALRREPASWRWRSPAQEAWLDRARRRRRRSTCRPGCARSSRRSRSRRAPIGASTSAPASASACRSACSRTSRATPSGGRWRRGEAPPVARISDVYAALPSITGKFELEYEGELRGADAIAPRADPRRRRQRLPGQPATRWTPRASSTGSTRGGTLPLEDTTARRRSCWHARRAVPGLLEGTRFVGVGDRGARAAARVGRGVHPRGAGGDQADQPHRTSAATRPPKRRSPDARARREEPTLDDMPPVPGGRRSTTTDSAKCSSAKC